MTSARSIFVAPFDMRDKADEARRHLAVAFSDHLTGVAAFDEWRRQKKTRSEFKWARAHFCGAQTLKAIEQSREQFALHLQSIGFVKPGRQALREVLEGAAGLAPDDALQKVVAEDAERSAKAASLLKALLCAGLYPNVLLAPKELPLLGEKAREPPKDDNDAGLFFAPTSKKKTAGEVAFTRCDPDVERVLRERKERRERDDRPRRRGPDDRQPDAPDDAAFLHPCCLDFDATALDHRCVVYREIVRTAKVYVRDATTVAPLALILFGGALTVHHDRGVISVDEKIHFAAPPKVATLVKILRDEMEALLLRKIVSPGGDDESCSDREVAFVDAARAILGAEAMTDARRRRVEDPAKPLFAPKGARPKKKKPPPVAADAAAEPADAPDVATADAAAYDYAVDARIRDGGAAPPPRAPRGKGDHARGGGKGGRGNSARGRGRGGRRISRLQ